MDEIRKKFLERYPAYEPRLIWLNGMKIGSLESFADFFEIEIGKKIRNMKISMDSSFPQKDIDTWNKTISSVLDKLNLL